MRNIEIFEAISGLLLAELYEHFPLKIKISPTDLAMKLGDELWDQSQVPVNDEENHTHFIRHKSPASLAKPSIEWLARSGLVTYEKYDGFNFQGVCLTPKGLESIKIEPKRENRLIKAAKDLAISSAKDAAKKELKDAFSEIFTWSVQNYPTLIQTVTNLGT